MLGVSFWPNGYPQIIHFNRVFPYKPSILGYHYFWKHLYIYLAKWNNISPTCDCSWNKGSHFSGANRSCEVAMKFDRSLKGTKDPTGVSIKTQENDDPGLAPAVRRRTATCQNTAMIFLEWTSCKTQLWSLNKKLSTPKSLCKSMSEKVFQLFFRCCNFGSLSMTTELPYCLRRGRQICWHEIWLHFSPDFPHNTLSFRGENISLPSSLLKCSWTHFPSAQNGDSAIFLL